MDSRFRGNDGGGGVVAAKILAGGVLVLLALFAGGAARGDDGVDGVDVADRVDVAGGVDTVNGYREGRGVSLTVFYDFFYAGIKVAEVSDTLTIDGGGSYEIRRVAAAVGLAKVMHGDVSNSSAGRVAEYGLQMSVYRQKRGRRAPQSAFYDGENLRLRRGEERREEKAANPMYDYLTVIYSHFVAGRALTGTVTQTDGWRVREYVYESGEEEMMQTPFGELRVLPVSYKSDRGPRIFWLAPELGFLPVRSIVDDKGHVFETVLTGASPSPLRQAQP